MITLTETAAREVRRIISEMEDPQYLRVGVRGGGCSGFNYLLNLDPEKTDKDTEYEQHDVKIIVDSRSALYLDGVTVDFHEDISKRGFVFANPRAVGSCGCGKSFSV